MDQASAISSCQAMPVCRIRHQQSTSFNTDQLVEEVPVAIVYNGISHAVLMSLPSDLEDLAIGFSLTEGIIDRFEDIRGIDIVPACSGVEVAVEISSRCFQRLKSRRRNLAGTTGCGICGTEQLSHVSRELPVLEKHLTLDALKIDNAFDCLKQQQRLNQETGATHAAGWITDQAELVAVREDVGRHIALDKLIGYLARNHIRGGAVLVTSRASFEMVQKAIVAGVEALFAISAVTKKAVVLADQCNLTLAGFCRPGKLSIYSHCERLLQAAEEVA
ncbi:formate dehydrogenase accessory sulfurtransferase FdhD [Endozoicomonas sp. Mp262]|uniref:formate dehydrogenase accessory sulfurtransferase FdhD n=1 Tax=Endozoicomonas sp. Mp262 TaxID=2919499 RepID=UPI0021D820C8